MRVLALLLTLGVTVPASAQIEEHASGFQWKEPAGTAQPAPPSCGWCVGSEIGLSFAGIFVGGAIGFVINQPAHYSYGEPIWIGASVGLAAGAFAAALATRSFDGNFEWLGAGLGALAGVVLGGGGAFLCFLGFRDTFTFSGSNTSALGFLLLGVSIAAVVPALSVTLGLELPRSRRISAAVTPLPGGGGAASFSLSF